MSGDLFTLRRASPSKTRRKGGPLCAPFEPHKWPVEPASSAIGLQEVHPQRTAGTGALYWVGVEEQRQPRNLQTPDGNMLRLGRTSFVGGQEDFTSRAPASTSIASLRAVYGAPGSSFTNMRSTSPMVSPQRGRGSATAASFSTGDTSISLISSARVTGVASPTRMRARPFSKALIGGLGADPVDRFDQYPLRNGGFNFM